MNSWSFTSLAVLGIVRVLNISHSNSCVVIPYYSFNLHCPKDKRCQSAFHMLICCCISSLVRCLFRSFAHFLLRDLFFVFRVLSTIWIPVLYHICVLQIFSPVCDLSFYFLNSAFCRAENF